MFTFKQRKISDLIAHEANSPWVGYDRDEAVVTLAAAQVLTLGTVVTRPKGDDGTAKWVPVTAAGDFTNTNDFGLVISDHLGEQKDVSGAGDRVVVILARGPVVVKDYTVFKALEAMGVTLTDPERAGMKRLLSAQGIHAEITIK